jgi:cytochrome c-type biogenesis protein CcmH
MEVVWTMLTFWLMAAGLAGLVAATLVRAMMVAGVSQDADARSVYADQLADIARDRERGTILPEEAGRLRAEVARRLLAADRTGGTVAATRGPAGLAVALAAAVVLAGGAGAYLWLGVPGYADLPLSARIAQSEALRDARPTQAEAEAAAPRSPPLEVDADFARLMDALRAKVAARPDDIAGHRLLAENEARIGNGMAARVAQERVVALAGAAATAEDHATLARFRIAAAGGVVTPEAETAMARALQADDRNDTALFLAGFAEMQVGRPDRAFRYWKRLVEVAPEGSEWLPEVRARIEGLATAAGARYTLPALPGPSAEDMAAAADMTPEDRTAMAQGMVQRLSERLASDGGSAEEWARLIGALGVLGDRAKAGEIWAEAQTNFAGREGDLAMIRAAAVSAGVAE